MATRATIGSMGPIPSDVEKSTMKAIHWRIVVPLFVLFFFNAIDRANVSFAALQMNADLGLSPRAYGFGAGMTFIALLLCQWPSMALLRRMSSRLWLASITIGWGAVSVAMAGMSNATEFAVLRFFLGFFEAGFSPGFLYLITQWMPQRLRGSATGLIIVAVPLSLMLGGPVCGWLLVHGALVGMAGWRFLYLANGLATVLAGISVFIAFGDAPLKATWLSDNQRRWIVDELEAESTRHPVQESRSRVKGALATPSVWVAAYLWCMLTSGMFGLVFWLPQLVKASSIGQSDLRIASISSLPWLAAAIGAFVNGRLSDRTGQRRLHVGLPALLGSLGLLIGWTSRTPGLSLAGLMLAGLGLGAAHGVFWTIPMAFLPRKIMAHGILIINLASTVAGLLITNMVGAVREATGSFVVAGYILSGMVLTGVVVLLLLPKDRREADDSIVGR